MGVPVLAAHMFVFYFGIIADVTPPVALAAYAGAGIAGGNPLWTGVNASKLAIAAFIIPYIFVLSPVLLMQGDASLWALLSSTITAIIGMVAISSAMIGYLADNCRPYERIILIIGGLSLLKPGLVTDLCGIMLFAIVLFFQLRRKKAAQLA